MIIIANAIDKIHRLKEKTQEYFTYKQTIGKGNVNNISECRTKCWTRTNISMYSKIKGDKMTRKRNTFQQPCSSHWNEKTCEMHLSHDKDLQTSFGDKSVKSVRGRTDSVWTILYIQCTPSTIRSVCVCGQFDFKQKVTEETTWEKSEFWDKNGSVRGRKCGLGPLSRCLFMHCRPIHQQAVVGRIGRRPHLRHIYVNRMVLAYADTVHGIAV